MKSGASRGYMSSLPWFYSPPQSNYAHVPTKLYYHPTPVKTPGDYPLQTPENNGWGGTSSSQMSTPLLTITVGIQQGVGTPWFFATPSGLKCLTVIVPGEDPIGG
eukprot:286170-Hanusia_phi.AAC.1